jgi:cobalamin biosynthesis protein CbiG
VGSLIDLFYKQEELARAEEQKTDAILDGKKDSEQTETVSTTTKSQEEFIEETVTKRSYYIFVHMYPCLFIFF